MTDSIERIRHANLQNAEAQANDRKHQEQLDSSKSLENVLFESFQSLVSVLEGNSTKAEAIGMIVTMLDKLEKSSGDNKSDIMLVKSGLDTLEKQLADIPSDSLKKIPKFLEQRDNIKVTNLAELDKGLERIESAIKAQELSVQAPVVKVDAPIVNVPAPIVNVAETDLKPVKDALLDVISAIKKASGTLRDGSLEVHQTNTLVDEKFDEYKLNYSTPFDDEEPQISSIDYYFQGKKVATLKYTYKNGQLTGGKRV